MDAREEKITHQAFGRQDNREVEFYLNCAKYLIRYLISQEISDIRNEN